MAQVHVEVGDHDVEGVVLDVDEGRFVDEYDKNSMTFEAGEDGKVHRGLRVPCALEDTSRSSTEREDVSGLHEVVPPGVAGGEELDGAGAVGGGDSGGNADGCVHRDGEGGATAEGGGYLRGGGADG